MTRLTPSFSNFTLKLISNPNLKYVSNYVNFTHFVVKQTIKQFVFLIQIL